MLQARYTEFSLTFSLKRLDLLSRSQQAGSRLTAIEEDGDDDERLRIQILHNAGMKLMQLHNHSGFCCLLLSFSFFIFFFICIFFAAAATLYVHFCVCFV